MKQEEILAAAKAAPPKIRIEEHREAVKTLREKGYTWRDIAEFFNEQGIQTDHTRIYRTFAKTPKQRRTESRDIQISKITYLGVHKTKKNNSWSVMEFLLPSKLGQPLTVLGHAWCGKGEPAFDLKDNKTMSYRNATLVIKSGDGFPVAYIQLDLKINGDVWSTQEVYIMPKWETLI